MRDLFKFRHYSKFKSMIIKLGPEAWSKMIKISVIVTNYNYGHYLGRCLRSLLSQSISRTHYEIIVVDDASTDSSRLIYDSFENEIKSIKNEKNVGLAQASNIGIRSALGRYFVRVDADDYVHPNFLETLLVGFDLFGTDYEAISCDYLKVEQNGKLIEVCSQIESPIACGIAFKIDAFEFLGLYNETLKINEESEFMARFRKSGFRCYNVNLPLYRYVQHGPSLSNGVPI